MILVMLKQVEIDSPPSGRVIYPLGAQVSVDDDLGQAWLDADPPIAKDPNAPDPEPIGETVAADPAQDVAAGETLYTDPADPLLSEVQATTEEP